MRPNSLRRLLQKGQPTIGTHVHSTWPTVVEIVGLTGQFDYVEFSGEYAPYDLFALENFCRAAELVGLATMIKLDQEPRTWLAQRAIGAGFQAVVFADVRTVEDARECVAAVRPDTPTGGGTYGAADRRHSYWGQAGTKQYVRALEEIVVILMIEKRQAVEQLDEILQTPGIDMIQWGPADFAMSIGRPGGWHDPEVKAVERRVLELCLAAGIPPRAELNDPAQAGEYIDMGIRHFCIGWDLGILYESLSHAGSALAQLVGVDRSKARGTRSSPPTSTHHQPYLVRRDEVAHD